MLQYNIKINKVMLFSKTKSIYRMLYIYSCSYIYILYIGVTDIKSPFTIPHLIYKSSDLSYEQLITYKLIK